MEYNYKLEERKRFFRYFRVWIIIAVVAVGVFGFLKIVHKEPVQDVAQRNNSKAPEQRVYDFAEVLTSDEEARLEREIAEYEKMGTCDLVLVTIDQSVGGTSDNVWDDGMLNYADTFYNENFFGYDQPLGDGVLFLDNWYHMGRDDSQAGSWLSTSGKMEYAIGANEERAVKRVFDKGLEISAVEAYSRALKKIATYGVDGRKSLQIPWLIVLAIPVIVAVIYAFANMKQVPGKDTTSPTTYVPGGLCEMRTKRDEFIRKNVTRVKIETSSSGRGGGGGGSYGHHVTGGVSHGGGGFRR